jgi:SAM-dependent methyltransferase
MNCRICNDNKLEKFLSLGDSPLANSFLRKEELDNNELYFPLELCFCSNCSLVQLSYIVDPKVMFKNYLYVSSTSNSFRQHFSHMSRDIVNRFRLDTGSLAVDIGSNDGILLKGFKGFGISVIGVEPAENVSRIAQEQGIDTINSFFNEEVVQNIIKNKGKADIVTACNVFAHIDDISSVVENVKKLLKDEGVYIIEVQYILRTLEDMTFDNIYHEHLSYYSLTALKYFFESHGMSIFDVEEVNTHGGSIRVFVQKKRGNNQASSRINEMLEHEIKKGLDKLDAYLEFAKRVYLIRDKIVSYVNGLKAENKSISGYGAPAKSSTLLNFCKIGKDKIDYIIDDSSLKTGLYTPGTHIPIVSSEKLDMDTPDCIIILAWNFAEEILKKTEKFANKGVRFIIPLPEPKMI